MIKVVVLSDTHRNKNVIEQITKIAADAYIHCGDSELSYDDPVLQNIYTVRGNCDLDERFPLSKLIVVGDKRILVVHGHQHNVKSSLMSLHYLAQEQDANIVLFGHSHLYGAEMIENILFVNPGSPLYPRGGKRETYAIIEWDEQQLRVQFSDNTDEIVDEVLFF